MGTIIKNLIIRMFGKRVKSEIGELTATSKTKVVAVIGVLLVAVEKLSVAWGHPIVIPQEVYEFLAAVGLWTLRDGVDAK